MGKQENVLRRDWRVLVLCCLLGSSVGLALWSYEEVTYVSEMKVMIVTPDRSVRLPPNIQSLMSLAGIDPSSLLSQLSGKRYKDGAFAYLLMSHHVKQDVARSLVRYSPRQAPVRLSEYVSASIPQACKQSRSRETLEAGQARKGVEAASDARPQPLSPKEQATLCFLNATVEAYKSPRDRTLTLQVQTSSRYLSASVAEAFLASFEQHARTMVQATTHQRIDFLNGQEAEAEQQVEQLRAELTAYESRNQGRGTPTENLERRRLERRLQAAESLASALRTSSSELMRNLAQQETVVSVLDAPSVPATASGWAWWMYALAGAVPGACGGLAVAFFRSAYRLYRDTQEKHIDSPSQEN